MTATATSPTARNLNSRPSGLLAEVKTTGRRLPTRLLLHATEKWGKSSFAAHAPRPVFLCSRGETGLETLIDAGLLPPVPHFPEAQSWNDITRAIAALTVDDHGYGTLVIDTTNGTSRLCEEEVCRKNCHNEWSEYDAYGRGVKMAVAPWLAFLESLDRLRERKSMAVILLTHTKVKTFKNPEGPDFDRYTPDMPDQLWGVTHKWADAILFGGYVTVAEKERGAAKAKGKGGTTRILYTQRTAAFDGGNRYDLPAELDCGETAAQAWNAFVGAMKKTPSMTAAAPPADAAA